MPTSDSPARAVPGPTRSSRPVPPRARATSSPSPDGARRWSAELVVGAAAVVAVAVEGLLVAHRSSPGAVDRWLQDVVPGSHAAAYVDITWLRSPWVVVVGSVLCAVAVLRRDRVRAAACLLGPIAALAVCEEVMKPLVDRTLGGGLSYPSGSTTGAAALAATAVLAVPSRWRGPTAVAAAAYAVWMTVAVVALRWHFPTDAVAGAVLGAGVVLLTDGGFHLAWQRRRAAAARRQRGEA